MDTPVFRVLGPLEVSGPCGVVRLNSSRERTILAMLALNANRLVTSQRLVDAVWAEAPPATAREQIHICISHLRRALARAGLPDRITTRHPGYVLTVLDGELDLHTFGRRVAAAHRAAKTGRPPAELAAALRSALDLFQGEPCADVDSLLVRSAVLPLVERRMTAIEDRIDAEMRMNMHHEVLGELAGLVAEHPLRERLLAMHMTALHRAGRRAEALAVYHATRRQLLDQLGVEPGADLRRAHREVLADLTDPPDQRRRRGAKVPAPRRLPVPRLLPPDVTGFSGRTEPVIQLREKVMARTASGQPRPSVAAVAIFGKGGVGKTAFAQRLAHSLARFFPDGQLYAELLGVDGRPVDPGHVLGGFLDALGGVGQQARRSLEEQVETYRDLLGGRRVLVVLDGACEEDQVMPLLPRGAGCLVVVTSRARLRGLPGALHVPLAPLDTEAAVEMLEHAVGRERVVAEPSRTLELVWQCDRLPGALQAAASRLNARPDWTIGQFTARLADESRRLEELSNHGHGVRESIMASYRGLHPQAKRLFARLAPYRTTSVPGWVGAPLLDCDPDHAVEVLDALVDAQLLDSRRTASGLRYSMDDLINIFARKMLVEESRPEGVAALRRVIATWLFLIDEVHRREHGENVRLLDPGAQRRRLPQCWIDRLLAEPSEWVMAERTSLAVAVRQAADIGADDTCWDLALGVTMVLEERRCLEGCRDIVEIALRTSVQAGNRRGEAAMLYSLGNLDLNENRLDEGQARLATARRAFEELDERHGAALALRSLATADQLRGHLRSAIAKYAEAISVLKEVGGLAQATRAAWDMDRISDELSQLEEARRMTGGSG